MIGDIFVTCTPGLEALLEKELISIGCSDTLSRFGGVYAGPQTMETVYNINYRSRIASRVLIAIAKFRCYDQFALYKGAKSIDWMKYIPKGKTFAIDANVHHPKLRNSLFSAQIVKDAICDQFRDETGSRPSVQVRDPDIQLNLFIEGNSGILSIDTSGSPLHKRGYRQENPEAPLRESLAAALLQLADYQGNEILIDPCCGSGTLLIEAALIATRTAPGFIRTHFGFMKHPDFSQTAWLKVKAEADALRKPLEKGKIFGIEINRSTLQICKTNLRACGFHKEIEVMQNDFREFTPSIVPNFLITNPPHGNRLDDAANLKPLYRSLGEFMKNKMAKPSKGYVFIGDLSLGKELGLASSRRFEIQNGGTDSRLLAFDLY